MLVTLFALPAFHGFLLGGASRSTSTRLFLIVDGAVNRNKEGRRSVAIVAVFAVLLAVSLVGVTRVSLSGDPRDLKNRDPELETKEKVLKEVFPGLADHALLVASSGTADKALDTNDTLYKILVDKGIQTSHIVSISPFLPSKKTQENSLKSVKKLFDGDGGTPLKELFTSVGFKESYVSKLAGDLDAAPLTEETYRGTGLERIIKDSLVKDGGRYHVITRVRAKNYKAVEKLKSIAASVPGCRLVSERLEIEEALTVLQEELVWMLATWLLAALVVLTLVEKSLLFGLKAALPAVFGVATAVALFGFLGRPLTPVASAGVTLVMGLGIDYGIFMQPSRGRSLGRVAFAVTASSLTTIAGFGVLSIAKTQAMADIGLIVLVGVSAAFVAATWLLPALQRTSYKSSS
jgi:predicted exporter